MLKKIFIFLLFLFIVILGVTIGVISEYYTGNRIFLGIKISNVYVGGLKKEEAEKSINLKVSHKLKEPLILTFESKYCMLKIEDLDVKYKIEDTINDAYNLGRRGNILLQILTQQKIANEGATILLKFSLDEKKLREKLEEVAGAIEQNPENARILFDKKEILKEKIGYKLNLEKSISKTIENLSNLNSNEVRLEVDKITPIIKEEQLKKINLNTPLASYSTKFNLSDEKRTHNIKLAASSIDGYVLFKDEIFSYNKVVGPRQAKYGYLDAPVIFKGKLIPGEGGGACQVSSTLFNVVLLSGFQILERTPHSRPSAYVPVGRDATVVYDYTDLKFKQDTQEITVLHTEVKNNILKISSYGDNPENIKTDLSYIYKKVTPNKVVEVEDENLDYGKKTVEDKGNSGYNVKILRVVKKDEKIVKKEIIKSNYKPTDKIIKVGSKKINSTSF